MNRLGHFWIFKTKDQRRFENDQERLRQEHAGKDRVDVVSAHTHLDLAGRKGFVGLAHSMPSFVRHAKNLLYAKWVRTQVKP